MMPGRKVQAIFGFVDIREFTGATEVLQEDVMVFVNTVGGIVHACVHRWGGVANKNIGDAFLMLWKMPEATEEKGRNAKVMLDVATQSSDLADRALLSFVKVIAECRQ